MREHLRQDFLDGRSERVARLWTGGQRCLGIKLQQIVQIIVAADNGKGCYGCRKNDLVATCAELDVASEKAPEFSGHCVIAMSDPHVARCQPSVCHLPADSHNCHQPELDLMPV